MSCCAIESCAATVRACGAVEKTREFLAHCVRFRLAVASLQIRDNSFKTMEFLDLHATRVRIVKLNLLSAATVQNNFRDLLTELIERCFDIELEVLGQALNHLVVVRCLAIPASYGAASK